jgi:head-tail adaptor
MPGGFDPQRTVVIREISHSEFMAASEEQATTMRLALRDDASDQPR